MGSRLTRRAWLAAAMLPLVETAARATQAPSPYDRLTPEQRRLTEGWANRARYDEASLAFRTAFDRITARLADLSLFDPENGEVLGAALDLIGAVEPPDRQAIGAGSGAVSLHVVLNPGARDRLRRSAEFALSEPREGGAMTYAHGTPVAIRIAIEADGRRALVSMP